MSKRMIDCPGCARHMPHYAKGKCNTCYKNDRKYRQGPSWLNNCQRCGRPWTKAQHRSYGLCGRCHTHASQQTGQLEYWAAQFELNRPDRNERLKTPENRIALKLARMVGATNAARAIDIRTDDFKAWASNREAVPIRWKAKLKTAYTEQLKVERLRNAMVKT